MIITKETDYAIRIIRALATTNRLNVKQICEMENLPIHFSYNIIKKLEKANFVKIIRGTKGGIELIIDIKHTSLLHLLEAMDENYYLCACMNNNYVCQNKINKNNVCQAHTKLLSIQNDLNNAFASTMLEELVA
ncbi:MAG: Rrf2 family transcriptional regulator [Bacilli bacterium]|jgi:Rrf2 family protein|nr:Rrf2 family transcriptional regulator [Bacilli bacterium]